MTPRRLLFLALPTLLLLVIGAVLFWQVRTKSLPFVDYKAKYQALLAPSTTDGRNGYDIFLEATELGAGIDKHIRPPKAADHNWHLWDPFEIRRSPDGEDLAAHPELEELQKLTSDPELVRLLDELTLATWFEPHPAEGMLAFEKWPELSPARAMARWEVARMVVAHTEGDHEAALRSFERVMALAQAAESRRSIIARLSGMSIRAIGIQSLRHCLWHSSAPEEALRRYLDVIGRRAAPQIADTVEVERVLMLDTIQHLYHGDGTAPELEAMDMGGLRLLLKSQESFVKEAEHLFDLLREAAVAGSMRDRTMKAAAVDADTELMSARFPLRVLMLGWQGAFRLDSVIHTQLNGTRTMLAIEMHRARHGSPPTTLTDLVPAVLPALPVDHFAADGGFIYRVLSGEDGDTLGRAYLLYSVGFDGVDDGGRTPPEKRSGKQPDPFRDAGWDWVVNDAPPRVMEETERDADE